MRIRLRLALCLLAAASPAQAAPARGSLDAAIGVIAENVARVVKAENAREIVVNSITDKGDLTHTSGPGLTEKLIEHLRAEGLEPALKANLIFSGEYSLGEAETDDRKQGFAVGRIGFQVKRRNGKVLIDSEKDLEVDQQPRVTDPKDLEGMAGGTVFLPPSAPAAENDKKVLDSLDKSEFEIDGTRVRPRGAPYAIEMLVAKLSGDEKPRASAFRPRAVQPRQGFPFLRVEPGEAVAVRIINEAGHDVASTVTIDGLSLFAFRDDRESKNEHVVVEAHRAGDILGWFHNAEKSSVFLVSDLPKDHPKSALLKSPAKIGSITVTFAAAWEKDAQRPGDEPTGRQATEITKGAPIEAPYRSVNRHVGVFRAAVTVRYDKM
jgi:hypothetical protein